MQVGGAAGCTPESPVLLQFNTNPTHTHVQRIVTLSREVAALQSDIAAERDAVLSDLPSTCFFATFRSQQAAAIASQVRPLSCRACGGQAGYHVAPVLPIRRGEARATQPSSRRPLQTNLNPIVQRLFEVQPAPRPDDVNWPALQRSWWQRTVRAGRACAAPSFASRLRATWHAQARGVDVLLQGLPQHRSTVIAPVQLACIHGCCCCTTCPADAPALRASHHPVLHAAGEDSRGVPMELAMGSSLQSDARLDCSAHQPLRLPAPFFGHSAPAICVCLTPCSPSVCSPARLRS